MCVWVEWYLGCVGREGKRKGKGCGWTISIIKRHYAP
jgi:hypothetical protein